MKSSLTISSLASPSRESSVAAVPSGTNSLNAFAGAVPP